MNINQHTTATESFMAMDGRCQSTFGHPSPGVVTNQCNVPSIYATAGPHVNNDPGHVSAYDGQSCLGLYPGVADPGRIQKTHIMEQPVIQQLPPRGLVYGQPFFQACNFPASELSYEAGSKTTMAQQARNPHGELFKTASKTA